MVSAALAASISLPGAHASGGAVIGQPFSLRVNQTANIEPAGINVTFVNVTEDSRCPSDVECVWAGQVSIVVDVSAPGGNSQLDLTLSGGQSETKSFGNYSIRLVDVQPYPVSTKEISLSDYVAMLVVDSGDQTIMSHGVFVKAKGPGAAVVAGWNVEKGIGAAVVFVQDSPRAIIKFTPSYSGPCSRGLDTAECIDGQVTYSSLSTQGGDIHVEIDSSKTRLYLTLPGQTDEYVLNVTKFRTWLRLEGVANNSSIVSLQEGLRDGPLLVQKIYPDRIEGLNFPEYPVATDKGLPITLRIGEKASNGCTITLTLVKIEGATAKFLKTVDEDRICPICWHQQPKT
jgi:hypothetical protein